MDDFLGVLTRRGSEEVSEIPSVHRENQWKNELSVPFKIPHEHSSHVKTRLESNQDRGVKVEAGARPCNNLKAGFDIHAGHKSAHVEEEVRMSRAFSVDAPPQSITKRTFRTTEKINDVTISAPANCNIRVYKKLPKKVGAAVGGVEGVAWGGHGGCCHRCSCRVSCACRREHYWWGRGGCSRGYSGRGGGGRCGGSGQRQVQVSGISLKRTLLSTSRPRRCSRNCRSGGSHVWYLKTS